MNDKQQLAAMGAQMAEQAAQPMRMAKRIEELERQVRALTVPKGWQLVPVVPGESMCEAGASVRCQNKQSETDWIADVYSAMLASAPKLEVK